MRSEEKRILQTLVRRRMLNCKRDLMHMYHTRQQSTEYRQIFNRSKRSHKLQQNERFGETIGQAHWRCLHLSMFASLRGCYGRHRRWRHRPQSPQYLVRTLDETFEPRWTTTAPETEPWRGRWLDQGGVNSKWNRTYYHEYKWSKGYRPSLSCVWAHEAIIGASLPNLARYL